MALNAGNEIENKASGIVVKGTAVEGGYFVTDSLANIPSYANKKGQLCYCTGTDGEPINKFYIYNGTSWEEKEFGTTAEATAETAGLMSAADKKKLDEVEGAISNVLAEAKSYTDTKEHTVDVVELPTSDISEDATYRILSGTFIMKNLLRNDSTCHIVSWETLPDTAGEPVIKDGASGEIGFTGYYNIFDNTVYGYFDKNSIDILIDWVDNSDLNSIIKITIKGIINNMSTGWKTMDDIVSSVGAAMSMSWGGIISTVDEVEDDDSLYLYLSSKLYINRHGSWIASDDGVGLHGDGIGAEIFNSSDNVATGLAAHAEGRKTSATNDSAHAEGFDSEASGKVAHAEGEKTLASGYSAHAEGYNTIASGQAAHTEGTSTEAQGPHAHAEGYETIAAGSASHAGGIRTQATGDAQTVIGKHNKLDANKAFIIGNGNDATKSNAMTVDWNGNAEFTGAVKSNGNNLATEAYVDSKVDKIDLTDYVQNSQLDTEISHAFSKNYIQTGWDGIYYDYSDNKPIGTPDDCATIEGIGNRAIGVAAHAEGQGVWANGAYTHAEGYSTRATGDFGHVEGVSSTASGQVAHAEGISTTASGMYAHAQGENTVASGNAAHSEGKGTIAAGTAQHVQGLYNIEDTDNKYLHIVGNGSDDANRSNAHTVDLNGNAWFAGNVFVGKDNKELATIEYTESEVNKIQTQINTIMDNPDTEGIINSINEFTTYINEHGEIAEGFRADIDKILSKAVPTHIADSESTGGVQQLADGVAAGFDFTDKNTSATSYDSSLTGIIPYGATGNFSSAFGGKSAAIGKRSHSEGTTTIAKGNYSHAEGDNSVTLGADSHAEGFSTVAVGTGSHAEGHKTIAGAPYSHAEGINNRAELDGSHAEGENNRAMGWASHVEGIENRSIGNASHAEGRNTRAEGQDSHAEGNNTVAFGAASHAEGRSTIANSSGAHAEGSGTDASSLNQHVQGRFNIPDATETYAHIVGNGDSPSALSNNHTIDWDGNAWYAGDVYVGSDSGKNRDNGSKKLATEDYVESNYQPILYGYMENSDYDPNLETERVYSIDLRVDSANYMFSNTGITFSPAGSEDELSISTQNEWGTGRLYTDLHNGTLKYDASYYSAWGATDDIIYSGTKTIAFKEDSEFDLVIDSEEEFKKCVYMLHPNKNEDGSVDLTTKGEPNPDFNYRYILVRDVDFTENLGSSDLDLAVLQPSIRYIKFDNCQWHCKWYLSGEEPTELQPNPSGTPTEYKRASGELNVLIDGIYISEQNVIDSIPTEDDPNRYYYVGLRNFERIENCFIHYPKDYALVEEFNEDGTSAGFRYTFKFNLQYFNTIQNCKATALWDGSNISNCRVSERIVRCNNCTNIIAEPVYRNGELYRVQMRESKNLSNISGSPTIYTSCQNVDTETCTGFTGVSKQEFDLVITNSTEFRALPDNTTASSVLVAIPTKLGYTSRVPGFFDNDISNEAYYSKLVIPKNVKYIKFAKCFNHDCPRVIIQGHEECIIDGLPTVAAPYNYTNCQVLYNFKEVRNCHAITHTLKVPLSGVNLKDLSTSKHGTISTNKYLENSTEYKLSFDLELANSYLSGLVYVSDYTDNTLLADVRENGHYEVAFSTNESDASTVEFSVGADIVDSNLKGSLKVTNVKVERTDGKLIYVNRVNAVGNVLLGTPAIAKYPQLAPDREEQKTKFINCDLGVINGASVIENCNIHFYGSIVDANNVQAAQSFTNVKRISGVTVSHSRQNKVKFDSCSNISSVNQGDSTVTYTNCTKIDTQSCDNAPADPIFATKQELASYATEGYVDNAVANVTVDLTGYAKESYIDDKLGDINSILLALHEGGIA